MYELNLNLTVMLAVLMTYLLVMSVRELQGTWEEEVTLGIMRVEEEGLVREQVLELLGEVKVVGWVNKMMLIKQMAIFILEGF
jgi:hypothetical protein